MELLPRSHANSGTRDDAEPCSSLGWDSEDHHLPYWRQVCGRKCTHCERGTGDSLQYWKEQPLHWCEKFLKNNDWDSVHFLYNEYTSESADPAGAKGRVICFNGSPDLTVLHCYVCGADKFALDFPASETKHSHANPATIRRRCRACFTCYRCGETFPDTTPFQGEKHCLECCEYECDRCKRTVRTRGCDHDHLKRVNKSGRKKSAWHAWPRAGRRRTLLVIKVLFARSNNHRAPSKYRHSGAQSSGDCASRAKRHMLEGIMEAF